MSLSEQRAGKLLIQHNKKERKEHLSFSTRVSEAKVKGGFCIFYMIQVPSVQDSSEEKLLDE